MRITDYELFDVPPRWQFLKLETSDGRVGWGEVYTKWTYAGGSRPATTNAVAQLFEQYLRDEDPSRIEDHWQAMYRSSFYRGGPVHMSAIGGIDTALWDLKGKELGAPVYDLLGGATRDRVRIYQHVDKPAREGDIDAETAADARDQVERGFDALKLNPTWILDRIDTPAKVDAAGELVGAVREAVGPDIDIALDFHGRTSKSMARRVAAAVEPHSPMFIEEPVTPEHNDALARVARSTNVPIATGERMYSRWEFKSILEADAVDVLQPDLASAGGISEGKKIADLAETYDASLAPHCPIGPICFVASLHVDAASPNFLVQEQSFYRKEHGHDYVTNDDLFEVVDGGVALPDGPGLGIDLDEARIEQLAGTDLAFDRSPARHADGRVAEQ